jgi:hypothetical protein
MERGILFSAPMVRALLDGSKTQTRRICKSQPYSNGFHFDGREILCHNDYLPPSAMLMDYRDGGQTFTTSNMEGWDFCCPYGQPGDRLWVRETWYCDHWDVQQGPYREVDGARELLVYRADDERPYEAEQPIWRPSIHMPRWASRILLEIVSVRVERLHGISEGDALAEGVHSIRSKEWDLKHFPEWRKAFDEACSRKEKPPIGPLPSQSYRALWESINGTGSWDANPWVWVVEFRRIG